MYTWIRNLHLASGLFLVLMLGMYGISAVQMSHPAWFAGGTKTVESSLTAPSAAATGPGDLARYLQDRYGWSGEVRNVETTSDGYAFRIVWPGTIRDVRYDAASGVVHVKTATAGVIGLLNRLHHLAGFAAPYVMLDLWGLLVLLTSVGLLILGATGVYLWFKVHRSWRTGIALLTLNLSVCIALIILIRTA